MDFFGSIAAKGIGGRHELLVKNEPIKYNKKFTSLDKAVAPLATDKKISTREELYALLEKAREYYTPFMQNHAPKVEKLSTGLKLDSFTLDGEKITLPHYGGPAGYAKQVYETTFEVDTVSPEKAYYVSFGGADYRAVVYLNGICVGIHEGFFSPFSFCVDHEIKVGTNALKIELYNDYIYMGNTTPGGKKLEGDKLYAATGLGWDDPAFGWHHCPPGMGIYGDVRFETKSRLSISDIFVRQGELTVEVNNEDYIEKDVEIRYSLYGRNFEECVFENKTYIPSTLRTVGLGDTLTQSKVADSLNKGFAMPAKKGANEYKIPFDTSALRPWSPDTPYLYELVVEVLSDGVVTDRTSTHFGNRSFTQDTTSTPKGAFYLNGELIKLRGANTMGFEQQDVLRGDFDQLADDILLAKLCNMNFLRFTQRPVDKAIYD